MISIYLDQNKIIELARVAFGKLNDPVIQSLHRMLLLGARTDRIVCPLTHIHIIETTRIGNSNKRVQLASLLAELSQGWFLANRSTRLQVEFDCAIAELFGLHAQIPPDPWPLVRGLIPAFGDFSYIASKTDIPTWLMAGVTALVDPREQICSFLAFENEANRRQAVENFSQGVSELVISREQRRSQLASESLDLQSRAYAATQFLEHQVFLKRALAKCDKTLGDLRSLPDELVSSIVDRVPALHIERILAVQLDRQRQRSLNANDGNDLAALCAALPYCRFVVSERLWAHLVQQTGLAANYGTAVLSRLPELHTALEEIS
jgi:hypothetical protein